MVYRRSLPLETYPHHQAVLEIYHTLARQNQRTVIAGGAVRDWLRGETPQDIDIVTTATPDQVAEWFPHTVAVGKAFGVMIVVIDGHPFEVATFRAEYGYSDGRRPTSVRWGTPEEDALRRDFTVNGLFYEPVRQEIWDFVGGVKDIEDRILRSIGEPLERFKEDHLRVLRAYRFRAQLGFSWDPALAEALTKATSLLATVAKERVRDEILRLFEGPHRNLVLPELIKNGVLQGLFPEIRWDLQSYRAWPDSSGNAGLLELCLWAVRSGPSEKLPDLLEALRLSREQVRLVEQVLRPWTHGSELRQWPLGRWVESLFDDDFRRGFQGFLAELDSTEDREPLNLAWERYQSYSEKPQPFFRAQDFHPLEGRALGEALRQAYWYQLEGRSPEEVRQWIATHITSQAPNGGSSPS